MWRTFCVNYEARTSSENDIEEAKRRKKNHVLKFSRKMTCFSGLLFLLAKFRLQKTVTKEDGLQMIGLTPVARLDWIAQELRLDEATRSLSEMKHLYTQFQQSRSQDGGLETLLSTPSGRVQARTKAGEFGKAVHDALNSVGGGTLFHRMMTV